MKFILKLIIGIFLELIYGKLTNTFYILYFSLKFQEIFPIKSLPKSRPKSVLQVCCLWVENKFFDLLFEVSSRSVIANQ